MAPQNHQCVCCKQKQTNAKFIKCDQCNNYFHVNCAQQQNPNLTDVAIEGIVKSKGCAFFKCLSCQNCSNRDNTNCDVSKKLDELEASIKHLSKIVTENIMSSLKDIKADVAVKLKSTEEFVVSKFEQLEKENISLRKQINPILYRADILISGLPKTLSVEELHNAVFKLGEILGVQINFADINVCTFIKQKKAVKVKFNSVFQRDKFMKKYFGVGVIKLKEVLQTDIESRIYINDNLSPMATKLSYFCRKLLKNKDILKFRIFDKVIPEAKLFFLDGSVKVLNHDNIFELFKSKLSTSVNMFPPAAE